MSTSDEQLIADIKSTGSRAAQEELVQRHLDSVRQLAYRMLLSHAAADDVTQDVFINVLRNLDRFQGKSQFSTWLYSVTMNAVKSYLRKQTPDQKTIDQQWADERNSSERPDQKVLHTELTNEVQQAITKLSVKLRTAIVLTSLQHLSPQEAAAIEGCSTATMHWRVHQARKQLKQLLQKYLQP